MKAILTDKAIFEMQAEICKTLTNPKRIEILNALKTDERTVTDLVNILGASKANVSQHLAVMRHKGILITRREHFLPRGKYQGHRRLFADEGSAVRAACREEEGCCRDVNAHFF
jgi:DNA-binding transcriptional ArsR family regulator